MSIEDCNFDEFFPSSVFHPTPDVIAEYLGVPVEDDFDIANIHTCVRIVGAYAVGDERRRELLVGLAASSIFQWMGDYGLHVDPLPRFWTERDS